MREDALFAEWRKRYGAAFIPDGVVDENSFASENIRFVFVLKEVAECYGDFDLRRFLAQGAPKNGGHTWGPVTRWLGAAAGVTFSCSPNVDVRKQLLKKIGAMNLKKTTGETHAVKTKIAQAAKNDADLLKEQVSLYLEKPTLFPCCGDSVFELFRDQVIKFPKDKENTTAEGVAYIKFDANGIAFRFRHPNVKESGKPELFAKTVKRLTGLFV